MTASDHDLLEFAAASLPSVWALELLLLLKSEARTWGTDELVSHLRASDLVVANALDALVAAGLVSMDPNGARYLPIGGNAASNVDGLESLYRARPNAVRRAIVSAKRSNATAFADAFKLKKD
ncbi:hypothetical protein G7078_09670 [Sphingomonas sinipercae]|uniref:Transcriptional regulator n=1 Tax=Sphingomonas sinipercae TaxID=2714944 RepID=A0A6G7ZPV4_9SPHN|nr:hypothetical protein [Sphingomonas sinipercae]QIL03014.1 hypothetical protein G7078_09670 [Sphingomonas sinipercae]